MACYMVSTSDDFFAFRLLSCAALSGRHKCYAAIRYIYLANGVRVLALRDREKECMTDSTTLFFSFDGDQSSGTMHDSPLTLSKHMGGGSHSDDRSSSLTMPADRA